MLDKMVLTFSSLALATTLGGGYVWAQGGFEPSTDLASVSREGVAAAPATDPQAPTGYGVLGATAPSWGPQPVTLHGDTDPTDTDAEPGTDASASPSSAPAKGAASRGGTAARVAAAAPVSGYGVLPSGTGTPGLLDTSTAAGALPATTTPATTSTSGSTSTDPTSAPAPAAPHPGGPISVGVASFNVLGSTHTPPGRGYASGPERIAGVLKVLAQHDVSVAGLQEFQLDQHQAFERLAPGWGSYPDSSAPRPVGKAAVVWRLDTWQLVKGASITTPAFQGGDEPMPYVLLRHRDTGRLVYVSTFHNAVGDSPAAEGWRVAATKLEIALFNRLAATGIPQLVTGDMNERDAWFCRVAGATGMHSAFGGTYADGTCHPTRPTGIDWVLGSAAWNFAGTVRDRSPLVQGVTDHSVVVTRASLPAA